MAVIRKMGHKKYKITISKTVDGTRKRKSITFEGTKLEAEEAAVKHANEVYLASNLANNNDKITFIGFAQLWFNNYANDSLKSKTTDTYKYLLNKYVVPTLGKKQLKLISPTSILNLYAKLRTVEKNDSGDLLSPTTITHIHNVMHKLFTDAVQWQYLMDNPVDRVPKPKRSKPRPNYYTEEQAINMLKKLEELDDDGFKWKVGVYIALFTGLRLGEISGLMWEDIDYANKVMHIKRTRRYLGSKGVFVDTPKTDTSFRTVSMPDNLIVLLKEYYLYLEAQKELCGDLWGNSEYILVDILGTEVFPDSLSKWFTKFIRKNDLPKLTFHGLRHTMATLLIHDPTVPERTISDRLGHANTNTLRKIYSHELKDSDKKAADSLNKMFLN